MSFIWRLFRAQKPPDDYESILSALAANIQKRQERLSEIRGRERNSTMLVTLYTLAGWLAYVAVWYLGFVTNNANGRRVPQVEKTLRALPVFVGPILILFIRRIVQVWYNRKGNAEEKTLQTLLKEQRLKVEEIKKKTNFYETRDLLSRYEGSAPGTPQQRRPGGPPQTPQQSQRASVPSTVSSNHRAAPPPTPARPTPAAPPQRKWYDAVADILVGPEDTSSLNAEKQKYALICERCFAHNGLVAEAVWADAQYTCPKCGHFNASARSRRVLERSAAPLSVSQNSAPVSALSASQHTSSARPLNGEVRMRARSSDAPSSPQSDGSEEEGESMEIDS
ncbi:hypothetical protein FB45DRAFT_467855 [Roridomyces roridus]|uniref:Endoplasmic reticulum junction formation protein lunapark n=1 Tax=Roridomyces roridus TaxID=1738132 RepID=A0AAD7C014_9AGAR|nr:hypothetical protein FB45DRAFT_467855 [Roridomyces roridus]